MSYKKIKLKELNLGFGSDVGAPAPTVLADEHNVFLLFYISDPDPEWDGTTISVRNPEEDEGIALITFNICASFKFGMPNDEAISGHPYYGCGLEPYSNFEVENSDWIEQLEKINSVHPHHNKEGFKEYKHYIFFFHDGNFECVAESFEVKKMNCSMRDAVKKVSCELAKF